MRKWLTRLKWTKLAFYAGRAAASLQKQRRICRTNSLKFVAPLFRAASSCGSSSTAGSQERTARAPRMPPSWSSAKLKVTRNIATESRRVLECGQGHGFWCCDPFQPSILPTFVDIIVLHVHTEEGLPLGLTLVNLREDHAQLAPPCSNANTSDIPLQCIKNWQSVPLCMAQQRGQCTPYAQLQREHSACLALTRGGGPAASCSIQLRPAALRGPPVAPRWPQRVLRMVPHQIVGLRTMWAHGCAGRGKRVAFTCQR
jgi:hypothetical protein